MSGYSFAIREEWGEIRGYERKDGYFFVQKLFVNPGWRNKGYGKKLMELVPYKAKLYPQPLFNYDKSTDILDQKSLIKFYEKLGFRLTFTRDGDPFMIRG